MHQIQENVLISSAILKITPFNKRVIHEHDIKLKDTKGFIVKSNSLFPSTFFLVSLFPCLGSPPEASAIHSNFSFYIYNHIRCF